MHGLPFKFAQFGIQYTNFCNYLCEHCGTESGNKQPNSNLGREYVASLLPILKEFGFSEVTFTGGECLVFREDIISLVRCARSIGLDSKVITNGSWARDPRQAVALLHALYDSGLNTLAISFDRFRAEFGGSLLEIENILAAQHEIGSNIRILVYSLFTSETDKEQKDILIKLKELIPGENLKVQRVIPIGRARSLSHRYLTFVENQKLDKPCYQVFSPFLDFERRLYRCCTGFELRNNSPLFLGQIVSPVDLRNALADLEKDVTHRALAALGPSVIFSESFASRSNFSTLCHFCVKQMSSLKGPATLSDFCAKNEDLINSVYDEAFVILNR